MASGAGSPLKSGSAPSHPDIVPAGLHASIDSVEDVREACAAFRGVADSLRAAIEIDPRQATAVPSTKGVL